MDSQWHLEIPAVSNGFRISSIVDILIDIKYTSREGGDVLRTAALANLNDVLDTTGLARFFSAKVDFGPSFGPFVGGNPLMPIDWSVPKFPAVFADRDITLTAATFFLSLKAGFTYDDAHPLRFNLSGPGGALFTAQQFLVAGSPIAGLPAVTVFTGSSRDPGIWTLSVTAAGTAHTATGTAPVHPGAIDDVWMVVHFTVS